MVSGVSSGVRKLGRDMICQKCDEWVSGAVSDSLVVCNHHAWLHVFPPAPLLAPSAPRFLALLHARALWIHRNHTVQLFAGFSLPQRSRPF